MEGLVKAASGNVFYGGLQGRLTSLCQQMQYLNVVIEVTKQNPVYHNVIMEVTKQNPVKLYTL
jgi:hypothetical protein